MEKDRATIDALIPVSGEADCRGCHAAVEDGGNGAAITGIEVATASQDPDFLFVPEAVSVEWATGINILRLHDANEGTTLATPTESGDDQTPAEPVVCQTCHYTPALDLTNVGPLGPESQFPADTDANGREQRIHAYMSRVIHAYHGGFVPLNTEMPGPTDNRRSIGGQPVINEFVQTTLNETCYQCHPGKNTQCLRGSMFNGGMVCQDCHGDMQQVGNDFSENLSVATPFPEGADLTKRVPWAHEPGCQSCHTGDAVNNPATTADVVAAPDGIRLLQAYEEGDPSVRPIVASNRRFAEDEIDGKQVVYRLSKGHGQVFCEGCHGSTHSIWPNANPFANDNVTANQIQAHSGAIIQCEACHGDNVDLGLEQGGPHGMHQVAPNIPGDILGDPGVVMTTWKKDHKRVNDPGCRDCHGTDGLGTVLSRAVADRILACKEGGFERLHKGQG